MGGILLVLYLSASSPTAIAVGNGLLTGLIPADSGETADAIVVLGRGGELRPSRVAVAAQLWQDNCAPLIFASGRGDALEITQMLEAQGVDNHLRLIAITEAILVSGIQVMILGGAGCVCPT